MDSTDPIPGDTTNTRIATNRERWLYSLANLGNSLPYNMINYLLFFYVDVNGLPVAIASMIMVAYSAWDALNNPIIGYLSDKGRLVGGRRLPYMRFGALPYALVFILIWTPPFHGATQPYQLAAYLVVVTFAWELLGTLVSTAYYSLLPEMFRKYEDRIKVSMSMNLVQVVGLAIGLAGAPFLAEHLTWGGAGALAAVLVVGAYYTGLQGMFERPAPLSRRDFPFTEALKVTFGNPSFLTAVISQLFRYVSGNALTTGILFYVTYSLGQAASFGSVVMGTALAMTALSLRAWRTLVAGRTDARTTLILANLVTGVSAVPLGFATSPWQAVLAAAGAGIGLGGLILMGDVLLSDVIDEDELHTGQRREGMFFGMSKLVAKLSTSLAALIFALVAGAYGYDAALTVQPETVALGFRLYISAPVLATSILAAVVLVFFPLHGERLRRTKAALAARRSRRGME